MNNKRGWIRIVEAFIAVLLIAGALLFVINKGYIGKTDISEQVYEIQLSVLREIELDSSLRADILEYNKSRGDELPLDITAKVNQRIPNYLLCVSAICDLEKICWADTVPGDKDIYAQAVAIAAQGDKYAPRQLKLFCWTSA